MKAIIALTLLLLATNSFAASVCLVSGQNADAINHLYKSAINTQCDSNATQSIQVQSSYWHYSDVAPVLQKLVGDGYNIVTQTTDTWTLQKK